MDFVEGVGRRSQVDGAEFMSWVRVGDKSLNGNEHNVLLRNRGVVEYTSGCRCWAIQLTGEDDRTRGFQAGVNFTLLGFGQSVSAPFAGGGMFGGGAAFAQSARNTE